MENLACFVPVVIALSFDEISEQTLWCMSMITAAAPIVFLGHSCDKRLRLVERVLNRGLVDQALEELLIELKGTCLRYLVRRIDCNDCRGRIDTFDKDLA